MREWQFLFHKLMDTSPDKSREIAPWIFRLADRPFWKLIVWKWSWSRKFVWKTKLIFYSQIRSIVPFKTHFVGFTWTMEKCYRCCNPDKRANQDKQKEYLTKKIFGEGIWFRTAVKRYVYTQIRKCESPGAFGIILMGNKEPILLVPFLIYTFNYIISWKLIMGEFKNRM